METRIFALFVIASVLGVMLAGCSGSAGSGAEAESTAISRSAEASVSVGTAVASTATSPAADPPATVPAGSEPASYFEDASALLAQAGARLEERFVEFVVGFDDMPSVDEQADAAAEFAADYMAYLDRLAIGLERLEPPPGVVSAHNALLEAIVATEGAWTAFVDRLDGVRTQQHIYAEYDAVRVEVRKLIGACEAVGMAATNAGASFEADCQAFYFE